jgi:tetratricopeptide (TPR) repeat protein
MNFLELEDAVFEIKQACNSAFSQQKFFFMIGAGVSMPSVPLAKEIVQDCKTQVVKNSESSIQEPSKTVGEDYSYWFRKAYPQRRDRQRYLRNLIEKKSISHANLRLAHLLLDPQITNLVVTTNFDDFLSRALNLFGQTHIVCDHPSTTERIDPEQDDLQVVHVHGSYWFYDCCNLKGEITERSQLSSQPMQTMSALLNRILSNRSPIVVGYSGWENDVFMKSLEQRLKSSLPYNLYWFMHRQPKPGEQFLPDWLCNHSDVYFVVPSLAKVSSAERSREEVGAMVAQSISEKSGDERGLALSAEQVFDEMIRTFGLKAPALTQDPLKYFVDHLRSSLPDSAEQSDIYGLQSVIARIERAKDQDQQETVRQPDPLEVVRNALRQSQYRDAIQAAVKIPLSSLDSSQKQSLLRDLYKAATDLFDDSHEELAAYQFITTLYDALPKVSQKTPLSIMTCKALRYQGYILSTFGELKAGIEAYNELLNRFGSSPELLLQEDVAHVLINKGRNLNILGDFKAEIAVYDDLVKRFSSSSELTLQERVAHALINKGSALATLRDFEAEIMAYEDLVKRFGNSLKLTLQEKVAHALLNKGAKLGILKKSEAAITVYDDLVERFGNSTELVLQKQVANALSNKGFECLVMAKQKWTTNLTSAQTWLLKAQENTCRALSQHPEDPVSLGNFGYIEYLVGDKTKAQDILKTAIKLGGETIRKNAIEYSKIYPLSQDKEFREMVLSIEN